MGSFIKCIRKFYRRSYQRKIYVRNEETKKPKLFQSENGRFLIHDSVGNHLSKNKNTSTMLMDAVELGSNSTPSTTASRINGSSSGSSTMNNDESSSSIGRN